MPRPALARTCGEPPSISNRFNLPSAKKPIERLSGDQNGRAANEVPANGRIEPESSERSHNCDRPSTSAEKTIFRPSGEIASDVTSLVGGVAISRRISGSVEESRNAHITAAPAATTRTATTDAQIRWM